MLLGLFSISGFTDDQIMADGRAKLAYALGQVYPWIARVIIVTRRWLRWACSTPSMGALWCEPLCRIANRAAMFVRISYDLRNAAFARWKLTNSHRPSLKLSLHSITSDVGCCSQRCTTTAHTRLGPGERSRSAITGIGLARSGTASQPRQVVLVSSHTIVTVYRLRICATKLLLLLINNTFDRNVRVVWASASAHFEMHETGWEPTLGTRPTRGIVGTDTSFGPRGNSLAKCSSTAISEVGSLPSSASHSHLLLQ